MYNRYIYIYIYTLTHSRFRHAMFQSSDSKRLLSVLSATNHIYLLLLFFPD